MALVAQTFQCEVCKRRAYGCRRLDGLEEISESTVLDHSDARVCPTCWVVLKREHQAIAITAGKG